MGSGCRVAAWRIVGNSDEGQTCPRGEARRRGPVIVALNETSRRMAACHPFLMVARRKGSACRRRLSEPPVRRENPMQLRRPNPTSRRKSCSRQRKRPRRAKPTRRGRVAEGPSSFRLRLTSVSGFPRVWLNIRWPCDHDRLRPLQTGRADFPHPASPDPSVSGMPREWTRSRPQQPQAKALQVGRGRFLLRDPIGAVTPTFQPPSQPFQDIPVQLAKDRTGIAVAKIIPPALQPTVHLVDHLRDGHKVPLRAGQFPKLFPARACAFAEGTTLR